MGLSQTTFNAPGDSDHGERSQGPPAGRPPGNRPASRPRTPGAMAARLAVLERQVEELSRSNSDLVEFASVAAHELRAPLQTIRGYAELLGQSAAENLDPEAADCLAGIERSTHRLSHLVDGLLAYARVGTVVRERVEVDLAGLLDGALDLLGGSVAATGASVSAGPLPTVIGDPDELGLVLHNLLSNSLNHTRDGVAPQVDIAAQRLERWWQVEVTDNGPGIDAAHRERVFRVFQRATTASGSRPGSGIGLSVCKRIVEGHGGRIWVEDNPAGPGTRMCLALPVPVCWSPF
ncbi:MAG: sensor histidine kinase [Acidimicrobiales bacterium]